MVTQPVFSKPARPFILVGGLLLVWLVVMVSYYFSQSEALPVAPLPENQDGFTACTMEARICPDGSAVGRTGPNCEFAPCPASLPGEGR